MVGSHCSDRHQHNRRNGAHHSNGQPLDEGGGRTGLACAGDADHGGLLSGEVFSPDPNTRASNQP